MKFIDLFAGLGGFHVALEQLGHTCVFASEKKETLAELYKNNFQIEVNRDISKIDPVSIPEHDILCAGFPCQPFSKAGSQEGLLDRSNGYLFNVIAKILKVHTPKYFILENVRNLEKHDNGKTWKYIESVLTEDLGYSISSKVLSPHNYGIPQHRERFFIVGSKVKNLDDFQWPEPTDEKINLKSFLGYSKSHKYALEESKINVLRIWQEFLDKFPNSEKLPSWPIWSMEFGATYPFENKTPYFSSNYELGRSKGSFGVPLKGMTREEKFDHLPNYAKVTAKEFPTWKKHFIRSNRSFFDQYKDDIGEVVEKIEKLSISSHQKFEWNVQGGERDLYKYLIQFRGSGVRIKRADYFPSLVTVRTQTPIIGWQLRYITPREGSKLQSLGNINLPKILPAAYSALGNGVNAKIVFKISQNLFS